jgi:1-acyl-sn-glycerol-3-phosphate acyltransferase
MTRVHKGVHKGVHKASVTYRFTAAMIFGAMRLFRWQIATTGTKNLPRTGGFVIAANHQSAIDAFILGHAPYRMRRQPVYILVKNSLFHLPVIGWVMRASGNIPVDRSQGADAFAKARQVLQAGGIILVFPEQTISPSFDLLQFKAGAVRLAKDAGVPLIPAASFGSHRFQTLGVRPKPVWRLPVGVAYGEPLAPVTDEPTDVTCERLFTAVSVLYDGLMTAYPDGLPAGAWWVPARRGGGAPTHEDAIAWRQQVLAHVKTGAKRSLKFRRVR